MDIDVLVGHLSCFSQPPPHHHSYHILRLSTFVGRSPPCHSTPFPFDISLNTLLYFHFAAIRWLHTTYPMSSCNGRGTRRPAMINCSAVHMHIMRTKHRNQVLITSKVCRTSHTIERSRIISFKILQTRPRSASSVLQSTRYMI